MKIIIACEVKRGKSAALTTSKPSAKDFQKAVSRIVHMYGISQSEFDEFYVT